MFEFRLPDVGEGVAEGELIEWHVAPGDEVSEDDVLAEVETDKAVVDLPSPVAGTIAELHADVGEVVPVGDVVVTIDPTDDADANVEAGASASEAQVASDGQDTSADRDTVADQDASADRAHPEEQGGEGQAEGAPSDDLASAAAASGRIFAPPSVRRLAREHGVDLRTVAGSGPGGRITAADVQDAAGASGAADEDVADAITQVAPEADVGGDGSGPGDGASESSPKSAIRRVDEDRDGVEEATTTAPPPASVADRSHTLAAPATRQLADELEVDLDAVPTEKTRDGEPFVEPADVEAYAEAQEAAQAADAGALSGAEAAGEATVAGEGVEGERGPGGRAERDRRKSERRSREHETTREPYRGVRRTIGQQMEESAFTAPHVTHHDRAVVTALVEARGAMQPRAEERGIRLTYVPFVLKAVVAGLKEYPVLNSSLDEENEEVVYKHYYDLGVATATDAGLMVPVVRGVDEKGLLQLASEVDEVVEKARERSIAVEEMRGGTFTITNFGAIGGEYATPIVNYPETAILGLGSIEKRPVVVDGEVEARHTLPLSLSIDHRVIDGAEAARFANTVIEYLENPSLLLLD